jgi:hypothetical protein
MSFKKGNTINLGRKLSLETRQKMSEAHKRRIASGGVNPASWSPVFRKKNVPWNKRENVARNAYFAGLIDGEGYISIQRNCSRCSKNWMNYKRLAVRTSMVEVEALEEGKNIWGGYLMHRQRKGGSEYREWVLQHGKAAKFLKDILPHLRIKKEQAEIALRYRFLQVRKRKGTNVISEDELKYRQELENKLKSLHLHKGNHIP